MKKKALNSRGGRGGKKQKDSAIPASPLLIPQEHQEDKLQAMLAALPVLEGPKPPPEPELQPTFEGVKERLLKAKEICQCLELSYAEVGLVLNKFIAIDQLAKQLPASVENSSRGMPPELWEFISGRPVRGSFEADAERNKKWVDFFGKRAAEFFQRIVDNILLGPSGAEEEAAEATREMIFFLLNKLEKATRGSSPHRLRGRNAAKAAYDAVLKVCHKKVETAKKRQRRIAEYEKRGRKKPHSNSFAFQCEYWARGIIFVHEDWLEDPDVGLPTFGKFPRPTPQKRFGEDPAARAEWEDWFFHALKHNILIARNNDDYMKQAWRSHSSDLKNRLIPSFWDKAQSWRALREQFAADE
jgi:hypothetical protein